jgi:hypothetical protein
MFLVKPGILPNAVGPGESELSKVEIGTWMEYLGGFRRALQQ